MGRLAREHGDVFSACFGGSERELRAARRPAEDGVLAAPSLSAPASWMLGGTGGLGAREPRRATWGAAGTPSAPRLAVLGTAKPRPFAGGRCRRERRWPGPLLRRGSGAGAAGAGAALAGPAGCSGAAGERVLPLSTCFASVLWSKTPAFPTNKAINCRASRFQGEEKAELG